RVRSLGHNHKKMAVRIPANVKCAAVSGCPARTGIANATAVTPIQKAEIFECKRWTDKQVRGSQIAASPRGCPCHTVRKPHEAKIMPERREPVFDPPILRVNTHMKNPARNIRSINKTAHAAGRGRE